MDENTTTYKGDCFRQPRSRKRKSWGDSNPAISFEIAVEKNAGKENLLQPNDGEIERLILDHFTAQPKIDFGKVKPGQTKSRILYISNPREYVQEVSIEKFPTEKGFSVSESSFSVKPGESHVLRLQWAPCEPAHCREMMRFRVDGSYRLMAYLLGQCPQPPQQQKKKRSGSIRSLKQPPMTSRQQAAFHRSPGRAAKPVLQPSNHDNVRQSLTANKASVAKKQLAMSSGVKPQTRGPSVKNQIAGARPGTKARKPGSCNERILEGALGNGEGELDPRMTMRLSKPTVLPPQNDFRCEDPRMTIRLSKPTILPEQFENNYRNLHDGQNVNNQDPRLTMRLSSSSVLPNKESTGRFGLTQKYTRYSNDDSDTHGTTYMLDNGADVVHDYTEDYVIETTETVTNYIEHCEVTEELVEIIDRIDVDEQGRTTHNTERKIIDTRHDNYDSIVSSTRDVSSRIYHEEHEYLNQVSRNTPTPDLKPGDIQCDTPTRRMTFKKDDPSIPDTPTRRMTFRKDDPAMPMTPVRRDTFHLHAAHTPGTPVIKSPNVSTETYVTTPTRESEAARVDRYSRPPIHEGFVRAGRCIVSPVTEGSARRNRARSESPTGHKRVKIPAIVFNDDTSLLTPEVNESNALNSSKRIGTYTKLNSSLSPPQPDINNSNEGDLSLSDLDLPYCNEEDDTNAPNSQAPRMKRDPKKLSVISERSFISRDSLDGSMMSDADIYLVSATPYEVINEITDGNEEYEVKSLEKRRRVRPEDARFSQTTLSNYAENATRSKTLVENSNQYSSDDASLYPPRPPKSSPSSVYETAHTSPCTTSDSENDTDQFEDSMAYLPGENGPDDSINATVLENSALMSSLLQQKLQRVASFLEDSTAEEEEDVPKEGSGRTKTAQKNDELSENDLDSSFNTLKERTNKPDSQIRRENSTYEKHDQQRHRESVRDQSDSIEASGSSENNHHNSPDMSIREFRRRMEAMLPEESPSQDEASSLIDESSQDSLLETQQQDEPVPSHIKVNAIKNTHFHVAGQQSIINDSLASLIASPLFRPLPTDPVMKGKNVNEICEGIESPVVRLEQEITEEQRIDESLTIPESAKKMIAPVKAQLELKETTAMDDSLADLLNFKSPSALPPAPVFKEQTPVNKVHQYHAQSPAFRAPADITSFKYRPSEVPQNPFDMTRSSTIGIVNPGFDDSIFAERMSLANSNVISSLGYPHEKRISHTLQSSQTMKSSQNISNQQPLSGIQNQETVVAKQVQKESPMKKCNTTFEKDGGVLKVNELSKNRTFEKEEMTDTGAMEEADVSVEDEPLSLTDLAVSPSKTKSETLCVEIRQRLSSTPASTMSDDAYDVTPSRALRHQSPAFLTPSPIVRQSLARTSNIGIKANLIGFENMEEFGKSTIPEDAHSAQTQPDPRRFSTATVTKSRPSLIAAKIPRVDEPKRALFDEERETGYQDGGKLERDDFKPPLAFLAEKSQNVDKNDERKVVKSSSGGLALDISPPKKQNATETDTYKERISDRNLVRPALRAKRNSLAKTLPINPRPPIHRKSSTAAAVPPVKRDLSTEPPQQAVRKRARSEQQTGRPGASSAHPGASSVQQQQPHASRPGTRKSLSQSQIMPGKQANTSLRLSRTTQLRKQAALGSMKASQRQSDLDLSTCSTSSMNSSTRSSINSSRSSTANTSTRTRRPSKGGVPKRTLSLMSSLTKTAQPRHPLMFAAKNIYYDERWMEKQDRGFTKWLNHVLTPPDFLLTTNTPTKLDLKALISDECHVAVAPTKEAVSLRTYSSQRRLNRLRRDACRLYTSDAFVAMTIKLEREVNASRIAMRADRNVFADLGLKRRVLDLLLGYNPLWLRLGLEVVYGEVIGVAARTDVMRLTQFIVQRLLGNPDIRDEFAHPTVPHSFRPGYYEAMAQFALKKFLLIVMFLDMSKKSRLIAEDPCLFCIDAEFKSSKALLLSFSRDFLAAEGDLVKHLGLLGYRVTHAQTALEEVDYGVTNLAVDLRDGLRLTRVVSLLSGEWALTSSLRCPAISRLQKVHNVQVALRALQAKGASLNTARGGSIEAKDIVDGHREKTLQLLWTLILHFQVEQTIDRATLESENTFLRRELVIKKKLAALELDMNPETESKRDSGVGSDLYTENESVQLLLRWCKLVCAHYDLHVENFTVSFSDGRALLYLVQHYHPCLVPHVHTQTTQTHAQKASSFKTDADFSADDSFTFSTVELEDESVVESLLENERENYRHLHDAVTALGGVPLMLRAADMSATIPDEKVVVTYVSHLCSRLLDLREECRAARVIQAAWRQYLIRHKTNRLQTRIEAATVIQRHVRVFLERMRAKRRHEAVTMLQRSYRGYRARQTLKHLRTERDRLTATVCIQSYYRGYVVRARLNYEREQRLVEAANVCLQRFVRGFCARQQLKRLRLAKQKWEAALCIQRFTRGYLSRKHVTLLKQHVEKMNAILCIQRNFRCKMAVAKLNCLKQARMEKQAALLIQGVFKIFVAKQELQRLRIAHERNQAVISIQHTYRGYKARQFVSQLRHEKQQNTAAECIQRAYRCHWARMEMQSRKEQRLLTQRTKAANVIQAHFRGWLCRRQMSTRHEAATKVQAHWRAVISRRRFRRMLHAAMCLQQKWHAIRLARNDRQRYQKMQSAVTLLQRCVRRFIKRRQDAKIREILANTAATKIQATLSMIHQRRKFLRLKNSAILIQSLVRGRQHRQAYTRQRQAAIKLQALEKINAILCIQRNFRCKVAVSKLNCLRQVRIENQAALSIQGIFRMFVAKQKLQRLRIAHKRDQAVISIQRTYRGYKARQFVSQLRHEKQQNTAAECIQRAYRCHWARMEMQSRKEQRLLTQRTKAANMIQANFRGWLCRRELAVQHDASTKVQAHWRAVIARRRFLRMRHASMCLQQKWRAIRLARNDRERFQLMQSAITILQRCVRRFIKRRQEKKIREILANTAATKIQATLSMIHQRRKFLRLKNSAIMIQSLVRCRRQRQAYIQQRQATIILQAFTRSVIAKRRFLSLKSTAIVLQSFVRGKMQRKQYLEQKQATITIQSHFRRHLAEKELRDTRKAAVIIQSVYRGWRVRKILKNELHAATVIQSYVRMHQQKQRYEKLRKATIFLQSLTRGLIVRRDLKQQAFAAVIIQAQWKAYTQRTLYNTYKNAAIKLQSATRGVLCRREYVKLRKAAIMLQSHMRCLSKRRQYVTQKRAAVTLQTHVRRQLAVTWYQKQRFAAITIQSCFKGWKQRTELKSKQRAAIVLQSYARMWQHRKLFLKQKQAVHLLQGHVRRYIREQDLARKSDASVAIQSYWKGYKQKSAYQRQRHAAITVQSHYRALKQRVQYKQTMHAIVKLQSHVRHFIQQRRYLQQKERVILLQSYVRSWITKTRYEQIRKSVILLQASVRRLIAERQFQKQKSATIVLQARVRGYIARSAYNRERQAAIAIQSCYRSHCARKTLTGLKSEHKFRTQTNAAVVIQSHLRNWRQVIAFRKQKQACIKLQSYVRRFLTRQKYLHQKQAAIKIQSHIRCWREQVTYNRTMSAISCIQKNVKCALTRRRYLKQKQAATIVQSHIRTWSARRQFQNTKTAVITLQKYARSFLAKKEVKHRRDVAHQQKIAATSIQLHFRAWKQRKEYQSLRKSVIVLQASVRSWLLLRRYRKQRKAALCIQSYARSYLVRKKLKHKHKSAVKIQSCVRRYLRRKEYLSQKHAVVVLQSYVRMRQQQKSFTQLKTQVEFERKTTAAVTLQSYFKGWKQRQEFQRLLRATVTVQSFVRRWLSHKQYVHKKKSAIILQSSIRAWLQKRRYQNLKSSATILQSHFRSYKQRMMYQKIQKSTVLLQSCVRCWRARREYLKFRSATVILQSALRCWAAKSAFQKQKRAAIVIQSHFKCRQEHVRYMKVRNATLCIQKYVRRHQRIQNQRKQLHVQIVAATKIQNTCKTFLMRKRFTNLKSSTVLIQRYWRCTQTRRQFSRTKTSAILIQRQWRKVMVCRRFNSIKQSAVIIQRQWRRFMYVRHYNRVSKATRCVQQWWRSVVATRQQRETYQNTRRVVIGLQARMRSVIARRRYKKLQSAAVTVQRVWRTRTRRAQARTTRRVHIIRRHRAAVTIQTNVKCYLARTRVTRQAAMTIQSVIRGVLIRRRIELLRRVTLRVQRAFRAKRASLREQREQQAAGVIQRRVRGFLARRHYTKYMSAVLKCQALWRGRCTRRLSTSKKISAARQRIETARVKAKGQQTLRQRTFSALDFLLKMKHVDPLIEALVELDKLTQLLPQCCEQLVQLHAVPVLYKLVITCNRSEPHIRIITYALNALLNVAMYEKTRPYVYLGEEETVSVLVDQIFIHRFKKSPIFTRACILLGVMAQNQEFRQDMMRQRAQIEKLSSVYKMVMLRNAREDERLQTAARMAALKKCTMPPVGTHAQPRVRLNTSPAWVLSKGKKREVLDHRQAISFTLQALELL